jgi:hypothetical protein
MPMSESRTSPSSWLPGGAYISFRATTSQSPTTTIPPWLLPSEAKAAGQRWPAPEPSLAAGWGWRRAADPVVAGVGEGRGCICPAPRSPPSTVGGRRRSSLCCAAARHFSSGSLSRVSVGERFGGSNRWDREREEEGAPGRWSMVGEEGALASGEVAGT